MEAYVVDSLLCYVQSARDKFSTEEIIKNVVGFYPQPRILQSKTTLFTSAKTKMIKRKACDSHPNPADADVMDILELWEKINEGAGDPFPTFVSVGVDSMPSGDFNAIASILCSLRDEISCLRHEVTEVRSERERDIKVLEQSDNIMEELSEIKILCKSKPSNTQRISSEPPVQLTTEKSIVMSNKQSNSSACSNVPNTWPFSTNLRKPSALSSTSRHESTYTVNNDKEKHDFSHRKKVYGKKGTKTSTGILVGSKPTSTIYVGGCTTDATENSLIQYCNDQGVDVKDVTELNTRSLYSKSFRITIDASLNETVMKEDFWPERIVFRKFFFPRNRN